MLSLVLSRQNFREYDQIISLYTLEQGKIEVLARGVKKILSKNSSYLEPGCIIEAEVIPGKEVYHLGSVQPLGIPPQIKASVIKNTLLGWSLNLVREFLHDGERDDRMFKLLFGWIKYLNSCPSRISITLAGDVFVIRFFRLLGFDIVYEEKIGAELRHDLELLMSGGWEVIERLKMEEDKSNALHTIIYQFVLYHSENKIGDWGRLKNFLAS